MTQQSISQTELYKIVKTQNSPRRPYVRLKISVRFSQKVWNDIYKVVWRIRWWRLSDIEYGTSTGVRMRKVRWQTAQSTSMLNFGTVRTAMNRKKVRRKSRHNQWTCPSVRTAKKVGSQLIVKSIDGSLNFVNYWVSGKSHMRPHVRIATRTNKTD